MRKARALARHLGIRIVARPKNPPLGSTSPDDVFWYGTAIRQAYPLCFTAERILHEIGHWLASSERDAVDYGLNDYKQSNYQSDEETACGVTFAALRMIGGMSRRDWREYRSFLQYDYEMARRDERRGRTILRRVGAETILRALRATEEKS